MTIENTVHSEYIPGAFFDGTPKRMTYYVEEGKLVADERLVWRVKKDDDSTEERILNSSLNKKRTLERNPLVDRLELDLIAFGLYGAIGAYCELVANHLGEKMIDVPGIVGGVTTVVFYLAARMGGPSQDYQENNADLNAWRKYKGMKTSE